MVRIVAIALLAIAACAATGDEAPRESSDPGVRVSLTRLIAVPDEFHDKKVYVSGFAFIEFENSNLCISREPWSSKDCIWINFDDGPYKTEADHDRFLAAERKWVKFHRKVITIRGVFDAHSNGHLGGSSGEIGYITDVFVRQEKKAPRDAGS